MDVPLFIFDVPHIVNGTSETTKVRYRDYIIDQTYEFFDFVEDTVGKKVNEKRLMRVWNNSASLADIWQEIYEYRKKIPAPVGYADN